MGLITNWGSEIYLNGNSMEYGIGISAWHFDRIKGSFPVPVTRS